MSTLKDFVARLVSAVWPRSGVDQAVPVEMPSIGEVWRTTGPDGRSTVGVIVDYYPAEESVVLLGRTGKTARMPVRSLRLSWRLLNEADLTHVCGQEGCNEIAYMHYAGQWRCHRHLRPNEVACMLGEDRIPEQSATEAHQAQQRAVEVQHEARLDHCPVCGNTASDQTCGICGTRWKAVHQDVHRDVLTDVVARLQRSWRASNVQAFVIRVCPDHMGAVTDNSSRNRLDAITRGSPGGEEPSLCGITVVPGHAGQLTVLLARPPEAKCYVHAPTGKLLVRRGRLYYEFATGNTHPRPDVKPWHEVVPAALSHWRSLQVAGESFQVIGHDLGRDGCVYLLGQDRSERMSVAQLYENFVRFDRKDAPKIGSVWLLRGATRLTVVVGVQMQGDLPHVVTRLASEDDLLKVTPVTQALPLTDLWRNYDERHAQPPTIPAGVGDEWEAPGGHLVYVEQVYPETGLVRVSTNGESFDVMAQAFDEMTKVERLTAFERLMSDD